MSIVEEFTGNIRDNQQVFDFVTRKIIEQGRPSVNGVGQPTWHETNSIRCAIGWLVTVDEYKNLAKNNTTCSFIIREKLRKDDKEIIFMGIIIKLQQLHDKSSMVSRAGKGDFITLFKEGMKEISQEYKLKCIY